MLAWVHPSPGAIRCEERDVKLSAAQAAVAVGALLAALSLNFSWSWDRPSPPIDVILFNQDFAPQQEPPKALEEPPKEPDPPPPEPEPEVEEPPEPQQTVAELAVEPEPDVEEPPEEIPPPVPEPVPEPEPLPEPQIDEISRLIDDLDDIEQPAPDPELIDIYRVRIKSLIERHLRIPENTPEDAKVVLLMRLRPGGNLDGDPTVEESSGYPAYDNEAVRAVIFAQPFPMPSDPAVLRALQEIKLTVRP